MVLFIQVNFKMTRSKSITPPIKTQGIKTKLLPFIENSINQDYEKWIEPFMGSGVVGFNLASKDALYNDNNPHIIQFYQDLKDKTITPEIVRDHLENEGKLLLKTEGSHYYVVRNRFNEKGSSLDFLFLNRSCFNGMMRFNKKGKFNVPFCRKPNRFQKAYITKIVNQVKNVSLRLHSETKFSSHEFKQVIESATDRDLIYCDPPYIGRSTLYYTDWSDQDEISLFETLSQTKAKFILSTWSHTRYRRNEYLENYWKQFNVRTTEHFYHLGGNLNNRNSCVEAIVTNF